MEKRLQEAIADRDEALEKHDEMFASVSHLNKRIEELEANKLHLINQLKKHGDKSGLEY